MPTMTEADEKNGICPQCKGTRKIMIKGKKKPCPKCKGLGIHVDEIY